MSDSTAAPNGGEQPTFTHGFSSPSDNIMSPATKQLAAQRQRSLMNAQDDPDSSMAYIDTPVDDMDMGMSDDVATIDEMPSMELVDTENNKESEDEDDSSGNGSSSDRITITALPRRPSLKNPLLKLQAVHRANAVSSPSDKLMSPASQQLQYHRNKRLPRNKGTTFSSRLGAASFTKDAEP
ncbi:hypothetical protein BDF19DRAFT_424098 [Syncephalis fuscata]|nr:hypothetical protein BDF19DRAFT_424098 [Syncephalis fuscata]